MESWNDLASLEKYVPNKVENTNLLIVDGNNLGYRYLKRKNFNSFESSYYRDIESLAKSYACKDVLVAYDYGKSQYRLNLFPEYKANRKVDPEEKDHYDQFFLELNKVRDNLPFLKASFYGVEADDLIAYFTLNLYEHYEEVWIVSSDRDMYQLLKGNVHIFNIFSRKEISLKTLTDEMNISTQEYMLSRIIQGDSGDNISGIEGIGPKRGQDIAKTYTTLSNLLTAIPLKGKAKYIQNLNSGKDILVRNNKLINLSSYTRDIIGYGENGEKYLQELNQLIYPFKQYEKICVPWVEPKKEIVNISELEKAVDL